MKRRMNVIQINGFKGLVMAVGIVACLIAGFVAFPGLVMKTAWNFVSVKTRIAHSENSVDFSESSEEFFLVFLFYLKLFRIRPTGITATAAFTCNNAYAWHKNTSFYKIIPLKIIA